MVCENVRDKCRRKGPKVVLVVPPVELRARLGSSHVLGVGEELTVSTSRQVKSVVVEIANM